LELRGILKSDEILSLLYPATWTCGVFFYFFSKILNTPLLGVARYNKDKICALVSVFAQILYIMHAKTETNAQILSLLYPATPSRGVFKI